MLQNGPRIIIAPAYALMRRGLAAVVAERDALKRELEWTKQSLEEVRFALRELSAAVRARQDAEAALAALYREREVAAAKATQRNPAALLH
jgi:hypothetical protein